MSQNTKYCRYCGAVINEECIVCPKCGKQVETLRSDNAPFVINNSASSSASSDPVVSMPVMPGKMKNKWISLLLCIFTICGHKFYEGKIGMGILYLLTGGLFGIGWIIDIIILIGKPDPYYV